MVHTVNSDNIPLFVILFRLISMILFEGHFFFSNTYRRILHRNSARQINQTLNVGEDSRLYITVKKKHHSYSQRL